MKERGYARIQLILRPSVFLMAAVAWMPDFVDARYQMQKVAIRSAAWLPAVLKYLALGFHVAPQRFRCALRAVVVAARENLVIGAARMRTISVAEE